ncbi:MAG: DUF6175 family protein [Candidatus Dadabacteria bacterium]
MKIFNWFFILITLISFSSAYAQGGEKKVVTVQPKIIVVPFTKENEDIRTVLEADVNRRIAITKVKEAFDNRGFTTVDFIGKLKAANDNNVFTTGNQTDLKTQLIEFSGADIYVQTEVNVDASSSGKAVNLILTAYEASTGNSLSNKVGTSGKFYTDDVAKLTTKAVETIADPFLNTMQSKFNDVVANGKSILLDFSFDPGSKYKMSSEVGNDKLPFSDALELWVSGTAVNNNYHIQGTTDKRMIFDDVRIPLKDNSGNNFTINKYSLNLLQYFRTLNIPIKRDVKGNTLYVTIK